MAKIPKGRLSTKNKKDIDSKIIPGATKVEVEFKDDSTEIVVLLDRSGSMEQVREDVLGGLNSFIEQQKELDQTCFFTMFQFDTQFEVIEDHTDLQNIAPITKFQPRGLTALLDSIVNAINQTNNVDKKSKIIFLIITDGLENSSREATKEIVNNLIKEKTEAGWDFVFIGADQDAIQEGTSLGIDPNATMNYSNTSAGNKTMYNTLGSSVLRSRVTGASMSFNAEERQANTQEILKNNTTK